MKFGTNIHGPQRMNLTDFGDPVTFALAGTQHVQDGHAHIFPDIPVPR